MINKYSLLISPAEVESAIMGCDAVAEVAAVPTPDPITGAHICCFVVLKQNTCCDQIEAIVKQKSMRG
ncbi:unnamed protein product [Oppiella nova]|uniref:AMP-binding enzyme C-terminal domain-containing protein n=1 Tax=Oppiella nova TaxID=334625 RepID=A0A7R9MGC1_9ACAR|nr:unnamed protein product [Oppiella nova]CAG2176686.1 unnamed protein product [Oppiella nova]